MTRRGNKDGSIYQDKSKNCWIAEITVGYDANGKRRRTRRRARTKTEAKEKLRELQRNVEDGTPIGRANMTVNDLLDYYRHTIVDARDLSQNTVQRIDWVINRHLRPAFGRRRIVDLSVQEVNEFLIEARDARGLARDSLVRIRAEFRSALRVAQEHEWIHRNVAELATIPHAPKKIRRALTHTEAATLVEHATGTALEAPILIGLSRGLRPGEILGLRWSDLDLDADPPTMTINRSLKHHRGSLSLGDLKTRQAYRRVKLPSVAADALRRHRARQAEQRLRNADLWQDHDLVFPNEIGGLWDPGNFRRTFQKICADAGIGKLTPYELRHSAVSLLIAQGVSPIEVADLAGHVNTRMVLETYRHRYDGVVDGGASQAELLFGHERAVGI